jgi:hypothetical protein
MRRRFITVLLINTYDRNAPGFHGFQIPPGRLRRIMQSRSGEDGSLQRIDRRCDREII